MKDLLKNIYRFVSPRFQTVYLDYRVQVQPRHGHGKAPLQPLYDIIDARRAEYAQLLEKFSHYAPVFAGIRDSKAETDENQPAWNNAFLPGLDIVALYGIIAEYKPARYVEVGSGNSTKVARKAVSDQQLATRIWSIDPYPRAQIDHLADEVLRQPFENTGMADWLIQNLEAGDILFIDNSHRSFPNSDVTVFFMEVLPRLKPGVIVQVHDMYLPYDYPQFMCDRFYNEQYLLAANIMANPQRYQTLMPNFFVSEDPALSALTEPIWKQPGMPVVEKHGGSYWLRIGNM